MTHGKHICEQLKAVRKGIAEENGIPLEIEECTFKGECRGTCPRCEAEVRYLENALAERMKLGKVATIAGLALGLAATTTQAQTPVQTRNDVDTNSRRWDNLVEGKILDESIVLSPEVNPEFPGGEEALRKFINDNLQYPTLASANGIGGSVVVQFVVDSDGVLLNPRIIREIGGGCGEETMRIVKLMPRWIPGKQKGKSVRVPFNLSIYFDINKNKLPEIESLAPLDMIDLVKPPKRETKTIMVGGISDGDDARYIFNIAPPGHEFYFQGSNNTVIVIR